MTIPDSKSQITFGKFDNVDIRVARVISAPRAEGTRNPCRIFTLDLGPLGQRQSVGQYALIEEDQLVGHNIVTCINLGPREMGPHISDALVLGAPHPDSPANESQATPLLVSDDVPAGSRIY